MTSNVRDLDIDRAWLSNDRRYFEYSKRAWLDLLGLTEKFERLYPNAATRTIKQSEEPEAYELLRSREFYSDCVCIYSAMSVEAFINWYGVVRLGEDKFKRVYERLPLAIKVELLLDLTAADSSMLLPIVKRITAGRNRFVHPKTVELPGYVPYEMRPGQQPMPGTARECLNDACAFFVAFVAAVPEATAHVPPDALAGTV